MADQTGGVNPADYQKMFQDEQVRQFENQKVLTKANGDQTIAEGWQRAAERAASNN
jgi:hypothetical protein